MDGPIHGDSLKGYDRYGNLRLPTDKKSDANGKVAHRLVVLAAVVFVAAGAAVALIFHR